MITFVFWLALLGSLGGSVVKNQLGSAGDMGSIRGSGRSPREGSGYPLQYSCLANCMDRGIWGARVHGVTKKFDKTKQLTHTHSCFTMLCQFLPYSKMNQPYVCVHIYIISSSFWTSFPFRSPQCIKQSSLYCTVCSQQLPILYIVSIVYMCQSHLPIPPTLSFPLGIHIFVSNWLTSSFCS